MQMGAAVVTYMYDQICCKWEFQWQMFVEFARKCVCVIDFKITYEPAQMGAAVVSEIWTI